MEIAGKQASDPDSSREPIFDATEEASHHCL